MTAAVAPVVATERGTFEDVRSLLEELYAGTRGFLSWWVGRGGITRENRAPVSGLADGFVPSALALELVASVIDDVRLGTVTRDESGNLLDAGAVVVEFAGELEFVDAAGEWRVPNAFINDVAERLRSFPLQPSAVVDQGAGAVAVWLLAQPAAVDQVDARARIESLQRNLAERLGARTNNAGLPMVRTSRAPGEPYEEEQVPAWDLRRPALRLPGSLNHDAGRGCPVVLESLEPSRRYALDALEQAAAAPRTRKGRS